MCQNSLLYSWKLCKVAEVTEYRSTLKKGKFETRTSHTLLTIIVTQLPADYEITKQEHKAQQRRVTNMLLKLGFSLYMAWIIALLKGALYKFGLLNVPQILTHFISAITNKMAHVSLSVMKNIWQKSHRRFQLL